MDADAPPQRIVPPGRRRDKPILSCTLCRRRKLKCDRQQPCQTCNDRGLSLSCYYIRSTTTIQPYRSSRGVQSRIEELEKLVSALYDNEGSSQRSTAVFATPSFKHADLRDDDTAMEIPKASNPSIIERTASSYARTDHWTSLLDGITELKDHLNRLPALTYSMDGGRGDSEGPALLFSVRRNATKEELLAALPDRGRADELIAVFFAWMDASICFLHRPTFLREYDEFWDTPFESSTMWLGLLFAVLTLGSWFEIHFQGFSAYMEDDAAPSLSSTRLNSYREKAAECLILADYTKCPPYTMETCIAYLATEYFRSSDSQFSLWILAGMIVRMALRMGYHRDPSRFTEISPFYSEMRRRTWLVIISLDLALSAQVGLPRMILPSMYDTKEPRNLTDEDISEQTAQIPPSRPETELSPLLFTIVSARVRSACAKISDSLAAASSLTYQDVMDMDVMLQQVYEKIPELVKNILHGEVQDRLSPSWMRCLLLDLSFLKAKLILHRPYLLLGRNDRRYLYSRRVCLNAATEMLRIQREVDRSIQSGRMLWLPRQQLFPMNWFAFPVVANDFILATAVLLLDLDKGLASRTPPSVTIPPSGMRLDREGPTEEETIQNLQAAYETQSRASKRSNEARTIALALRLVLEKALRAKSPSVGHPVSSENDEATLNGSFPLNFDLDEFLDKASTSAFVTAKSCGHPEFIYASNESIGMGLSAAAFSWGDISSYLPTTEDGQYFGSQPS